MHTPSVRRSILLYALVMCSATPVVLAQTSLSFAPFIAQDLNDPSLSVIDIDALVTNIGTGTRFSFTNNSVVNGSTVTAARPTVTQIYWDMDASLVPTSTTFNASLSTTTVSYTAGGSPGNLPGGNVISFSSDYRFSPTNPQPQRGLDPGETGVFDFSGISYSQVLVGLTNGTFRIGMHIQEVGANGSDSKSFVNQAIPEPSVLLLGLCGVVGLFRRRR